MKQNHCSDLRAQQILILFVLAAGVFFRFAHLDRKVYWHDETRTSLRLSGYFSEEVAQELFRSREIRSEQIQKYQRLNPERTVLHTIGALALEDPKHPPLYFILARFWARLFGDSIGAIRSLSAVISLLVIPGVYWLCRELFDSRRVAGMAIMLTAVSPFHVLYAQEARAYSLWILVTILSSAAVLRGIRVNTTGSWVLYALTLLIGIYSHTLFVLVAAAHGIYFGVLKNTILEKRRPYLKANLAALAGFVPWAIFIVIAIPRLQSSTNWLITPDVDFLVRFKRCTLVFSSIFADTGGVGVLKTNFGFNGSWIHLFLLPSLILIGYALYVLWRETPKRIWLFVSALGGTTLVPFLLADLFLGTQLLFHPRYLVAYYVAVQLAVAYLLTVRATSPDDLRCKTWRTITAMLLLSGVLSCVVSSQAKTWWNKGGDSDADLKVVDVVNVVNQARHPVVLVSSETMIRRKILVFAQLLESKVVLRMFVDPFEFEIPSGFTDIFLLNPSEYQRQKLEEQGYGLEPVHVPAGLWRVLTASSGT